MRPAALVLLLVLLCLGVAPGFVEAQQLPRLQQRVVDLTGNTLDAAERERATEALESLDNAQLFALIVDTTGQRTAPDYATDVAEANGLGGNDALLVVAIKDRRDGLWVGPLLDEVSDEEIDRILAERVEPLLARGEFGNAIVAAAEGLEEATAGSLRGAGPQQAAEGEGGTASGGSASLALLGVAAIMIGGRAALSRKRASGCRSPGSRASRAGGAAR